MSMASRTAYSTWRPQKPTLFDGNYLRKRSTLDTGVLGYIGIVQHKEHSPEVLSIPPGTHAPYHAHFSYRTPKPDTTCHLDLNLSNMLSRYCQWSRYQRDLVAFSTLYSLLRGTM